MLDGGGAGSVVDRRRARRDAARADRHRLRPRASFDQDSGIFLTQGARRGAVVEDNDLIDNLIGIYV